MSYQTQTNETSASGVKVGGGRAGRVASTARPVASLPVSSPSDPLEREADRIADRVMRMTDGGTVLRSCSCGDDEMVSRSAGGAPAGGGGQGAGFVARSDVVPSGAGRPLGAGVRSWAEGAFGADFSSVRVHTGPSAEAASSSIGARAYTVGSDIVFGRGQYQPESGSGRRLLAHELTHTLQVGVAAARTVYRTPIIVQGRTFNVGEVRVNSAASADIRQHGNILPSADQAHIVVTADGKLGYEVSYTSPQDPFRWGLLKSMIDNESIDINGVGFTDSFEALEVSGTTQTRQTISLAMFMAGGITLPTLSSQLAITPGRGTIVASTSPTRSQVYYNRGSTGRGLLGSNSLAHEPFGHFALSMLGAPFGHGQRVPASANVRDPFGQPFVGSVDDFIAGFAGATTGAFESPTLRVGASQLRQSVSNLSATANGLVRSGQGWTASPAFDENWVVLSNNYRALGFTHVPQPATSAGQGGSTGAPTAGTPPTVRGAPPAGVPLTRRGVKGAVVTWFQGLSGDRQWVFRSYLSAVLSQRSSPRPIELSRDVRMSLPTP